MIHTHLFRFMQRVCNPPLSLTLGTVFGLSDWTGAVALRHVHLWSNLGTEWYTPAMLDLKINGCQKKKHSGPYRLHLFDCICQCSVLQDFSQLGAHVFHAGVWRVATRAQFGSSQAHLPWRIGKDPFSVALRTAARLCCQNGAYTQDQVARANTPSPSPIVNGEPVG